MASIPQLYARSRREPPFQRNSFSSQILDSRQAEECNDDEISCQGDCIWENDTCCNDQLGGSCPEGTFCMDGGCCLDVQIECGMYCIPYGSQCCDSGEGLYCDPGSECDGAFCAATNGTITTSTPIMAGTTVTETMTPSISRIEVTVTADPDPPIDGGGLSVGAKAGIGVGSALAALLIAAAVFFFFWRRRKAASTTPNESWAAQPHPLSPSEGKTPPGLSHPTPTYSATSPSGPYEVAGSWSPPPGEQGGPFSTTMQPALYHRSSQQYSTELPASPVPMYQAPSPSEMAGSSPPLFTTTSNTVIAGPDSGGNELNDLMNRHSQLENMKKRMMDIQRLEEEQQEISERIRSMHGGQGSSAAYQG